MMKTLFGEVLTGRLGRLPFLGGSVLLAVVTVAIGVGIGLAAGVAENMAGGDVGEAQAQIAERLGLPSLVLSGIVFGAVFLADLNLTAKRFRDIGLRGWWMVLAVVLLSMAISWALTPEAASGFHLVVFVALCLVPAGVFAGRRPNSGA